MKTSAFSQAGLLLVGGTIVLLIGALVNFDPAPPVAKSAPASAPTLPPEPDDDSLDSPEDLPLPAHFPSALAQIIKLTRAGVREDVIVGYVQNSTEGYAPTADEIIYMHQAGVAEAVVAAVVRQKPKPKPEATLAEVNDASPTPTPGPDVSEDGAARPPAPPQPAAENPVATPSRPAPRGAAAYFYEDLAPYGDWVQTPDHDWAWQPTVEQAVPDWRPYRDDGQWEFTDAGWYWQSSYPWGWAAFHYGQWWNDPSRGWLWQPGNRWAPAWVVWRQSSSHFGWAPLPPGVGFSAEFALLQDQHLDASQADFGLTPSSYTFVASSHFLSHNLVKYSASTAKAAVLLKVSEPVNHYSVVNAKVHNGGISPQAVALAVHAPVQPIPLRDAEGPVNRTPGLASRDLAVYRPNVTSLNSSKSAK